MALGMKELLLGLCFSSSLLCTTANGENSITQEGFDFVVRLQDGLPPSLHTIASFISQGGGFFIQDVDIMAKLSSLESRIQTMESALQSFKVCAASGLLYDETKGSCVNPTVNLASQSTATCNSSNYGTLRISNPGRPVVCTGEAWSPVGVSLGSFSYNPASSCSAIVNAGDYGSPGPYWIKKSDGSVIQQVCVNTTNLGGDGSTPARVSSSCASAFSYFGISASRVFVDANLNSSAVIQVYCLNGVSQGGDGSSVAASSVSCDALFSNWNKTAGFYFVNGILIQCFYTSCSQAFVANSSLTSQVITLQVNGITYPTWCQFDSGVAWTLLMKMDGSKNTFMYDSNLWTASNTLNPTTGIAGGLSDSVEYKSSLYNILPFTQIRFGMRVNGTTNWLSTPYTAPSMLLLTADGVYRELTNLNRTDWLILSRGSLQEYCNKQGINVATSDDDNYLYFRKVRFGIVGNEGNDCLTPDSRIGFGGKSLLPSFYPFTHV